MFDLFKSDKKEQPIKTFYDMDEEYPYPNTKIYKIVDDKVVEHRIIEVKLELSLYPTSVDFICNVYLREGKNNRTVVEKITNLSKEQINKLVFNEDKMTFSTIELIKEVYKFSDLLNQGYFLSEQEAKNSYNEKLIKKMLK